MTEFQPAYEGEVPTLGWIALDWISAYLAAPDRPSYEPFILTTEQAQFVLDIYAIDPVLRKRKIRRAVISRPRGWGKSPFLAAICAFEALGPAVFDGYDANGRPVGKPWALIRTPLVHIAAVSEEQTKNTWIPLQEMLAGGPANDEYDLEVMGSFINLGPGGQIRPVTSSARSIKGQKSVMAVLDQTEEWVPSNGGPRLAETMRSNATKLAGITIESPNAYTPGENSVAEDSARTYKLMQQGKTTYTDVVFDHREAPADTDLTDPVALREALVFTYGDSADLNGGWVDTEQLVRTIHDPSTPVQLSRSDFLNQITHASDAWLSHLDLEAIYEEDSTVLPRTAITLGFDGSRGRARSKADATALIGCRVSDGHLFEIAVFEPPDGPAGENWTTPVNEVEEAVEFAHSSYDVIGFFGDPEGWDGHIAGWEAKYGPKYKVRAGQGSAIRYSTNQLSRVVAGFLTLHDAIVNREVTMSGETLRQHMLNARRRKVRSGIILKKPDDDYLAKVDAAYAGMLAFSARLTAIGAGFKERRPRTTVPRRIY